MQTWVSHYNKALLIKYSQLTNLFSVGHHRIRYAIFPHSGPLDYRTVRAGYDFNNPLKLYNHPSPAKAAGLLSSIRLHGAPNLVLDCVKRGEDDPDVVYKDNETSGNLPVSKDRSVIVRVFDALGGKSFAELKWGQIPVRRAFKCNLLEDDLEEFKIKDDGMDIELRAFEVVTYRLVLA